MKRLARALAVLVGAVGTSAADDQPRFEVGAGTAFPLFVGVEGTAHLTTYLAIDASVGVMPAPYIDVINATVVAFDGYDDTTAELIAAALQTAAFGRIAVSVSPWDIPLSFHAGYSYAALGGGVGGAAAIEAVTGQEVRADAGNDVPMHSNVHFLHAGAAWRFALRSNLVLRVALEFTQAVASSSAIDATGRTPASSQRIARASSALDAYLDDIYTSYVKAPVLDVSLRWRWPD